MINHGGLGTVKECVLSGVPMIAFPSTADQPGNAARIVYHQLGIMGNTTKVTPEEICSRVETVLTNSTYKKQTELMAHKFRKIECAENAVEVLEALLLSH